MDSPDKSNALDLSALKPRTRAVPLSELYERNAASSRLGAKRIFSFGSKAKGFRNTVFRASAVLLATGAFLSASKLVDHFILGPNIDNGTQQVVADSAAQIKHILSGKKVTKALNSGEHFKVPAFNIQAMTPSAEFIAYLKDKEGRVLQAYQDSGGVWTIGYGHTGAMPDGTPISAGKTITDEQAEALLVLDLTTHAEKVKELIGNNPVSQKQFEALLDFSFNKGVNRLANSGVFEAFTAGDYLKSSEEFLRWIYVTKKDRRGVVMRDAAGKPIMTALPGLQTRAKNNYDMMRSGFSESALDLLEIDREKDHAENVSIRASAKKLPTLRVSADTAQTVKNIRLVESRLVGHASKLGARADRLDALIVKLQQERAALVIELKDHPAMANSHVSEDQARSATDLVGRIAVMDKVISVQVAERDQAKWERTQTEGQRVLLAETAHDLSQALQLRTQISMGEMDAPSIALASQSLAERSEYWIELAKSTDPSLPRLVDASNAKAMAKSLDSMSAMLDRAIEQPPGASPRNAARMAAR